MHFGWNASSSIHAQVFKTWLFTKGFFTNVCMRNLCMRNAIVLQKVLTMMMLCRAGYFLHGLQEAFGHLHRTIYPEKRLIPMGRPWQMSLNNLTNWFQYFEEVFYNLGSTNGKTLLDTWYFVLLFWAGLKCKETTQTLMSAVFSEEALHTCSKKKREMWH